MNWAREIAAKRGLVTAAITAILDVLVAFAVIPQTTEDTLVVVLTAALNGGAYVLGALWIRKDVTPADPRLAPTSSRDLPLLEHTGP